MSSPNLNISVVTDTSQLRSQMEQAGAVAQDAANQMTTAGRQAQASWAQLSAATLNANEANRVVKDTLRAIATGEVPMTTRATNDLALAQREAAEASRQLAAAQRTVKTTLGELNTQMASSYAQATLLSNTLGLRLGRGMEQVISRSPVMSGALNAAFPLILAGTFGEMIFKLGNDVYQWGNKGYAAARHIAEGFAELVRKESDANDQIFLTNAKLQQQIDKLAGKPNNGLLVALGEAAVAADRLADHLRSALELSSKLLKTQSISNFKSIVTGLDSTGPAEELVQRIKAQTDAAMARRDEAIVTASTLTGKDQQDAMLAAQKKYAEDQLRIAKWARDEAKNQADTAEAVRNADLGNDPGRIKAAQRDGSGTAVISAFRGIQSSMGTAAMGMEAAQVTESLNEQKGVLTQLKELGAQGKRAEEEAKRQQEAAAKLATFKLELGNNGLTGIAESLTTMPKGDELQNIQHILEIAKKTHKEITADAEKEAHKRAENEVREMENAEKAMKAVRDLMDVGASGTRDKNLDNVRYREQEVKGDAALGKINPQQELAAMRALHEQEISIERTYAQEKLNIERSLIEAKLRANRVYSAQNLKMELAADKEYQKALYEQQKLEQKGRMQSLKDEQAEFQQRTQAYRQWVQSISSSMFSGINAWMQHQKSFTQAMKQEWNNIAMASIHAIEQVLVKKLVTDNLMKLSSIIFHTSDVGQASAAALSKMGLDAATMAAAADAQVSALVVTGMINSMAAESYAAVAAAAALASTAAIPIVGPELAPAAAASMLAVGQGFVEMAAFDIGGVVPKTQVAMVHGGERVLTGRQNSVFERLISSQTSNNGVQGGDAHYHDNRRIAALDGISTARVLRRNSKQVTKEFTRAIRLGKMERLG